MREIYLPVLEDSLAYGALVVLGLEAGLLVPVHVRLGRAEVLAAALADGAREEGGVDVGVLVMLAHVDLEVTFELERLK